MKGLDTPVLLQILHGTEPSRALLKSLRGEELATSELNMFELGVLAARGPRNLRSGRQKALAGLRRRISVVPISSAGVDEGVRSAAARGSTSGYETAIWGSMIAAGCQEWITSRSFAPPRGFSGMKVKIV